jgi:hypothetical protein
MHRNRLAALKTRKRTAKDKLGCDNTPPKVIMINNAKKLQEKRAKQKKLAKENLQLMKKLFQIKSRDPNGKDAMDTRPFEHKFVSKAGYARQRRQQRILRENLKMMHSITRQKGTLEGVTKWNNDRRKIEGFLKRMRRHPTVGYLKPVKRPGSRSPANHGRHEASPGYINQGFPGSSDNLSEGHFDSPSAHAMMDQFMRTTSSLDKRTRGTSRRLRNRAAAAAASRKHRSMRAGLRSAPAGTVSTAERSKHSRRVGAPVSPSSFEKFASREEQKDMLQREIRDRTIEHDMLGAGMSSSSGPHLPGWPVPESSSYRVLRSVRGVNLDITSSKQGNVVTVVAYNKDQFKRYKLHLCIPEEQSQNLSQEQVQALLIDLAERATLSFPTDKGRVQSHSDEGKDGYNGNEGVRLVIGQTENEAATRIQSRIRIRGAKRQVEMKREGTKRQVAVATIQRHARGRLARKKVAVAAAGREEERAAMQEERQRQLQQQQEQHRRPYLGVNAGREATGGLEVAMQSLSMQHGESESARNNVVSAPQPRIGDFPPIYSNAGGTSMRSGKRRRQKKTPGEASRGRARSSLRGRVTLKTPDGTRVKISSRATMASLPLDRWTTVFGPDKAAQVRQEYPLWAGLQANTDGAVDPADNSVRIRDVAVNNRGKQVPVIDGGAWWPIELLTRA